MTRIFVLSTAALLSLSASAFADISNYAPDKRIVGRDEAKTICLSMGDDAARAIISMAPLAPTVARISPTAMQSPAAPMVSVLIMSATRAGSASRN